jgi:hypothetical protein
MPAYRMLAVSLLSFSTLAFAAGWILAGDFRMDNAVYVEEHSLPQSQGVTIFHAGVVYDFLNEPAEILVFDKAHRRFVLLDTTRHLRSEISMDDVQNFIDRVKQRLSGHSNPTVRGLADPAFEESFDSQGSELLLKSPAITYRVHVANTTPEVAAQYHEFSDWYAKFNAALNPSARPPFARLMLNEALDRHQGVAKDVCLSTTLGSKETPAKITSRHHLAGQLDATDLGRLNEAEESMRSFQRVPFRDYRQGR